MFKINYFWLHWCFFAACSLSLAVVLELLSAAASRCRAQALGHVGSLAVALGLGVAAHRFTCPRAQSGVELPCTDRQILNRWTTKEVQQCPFNVKTTWRIKTRNTSVLLFT